MFHYGGPSPKRHLAFSNSPAVGRLNAGQLRGWTKEKKKREAAGTASKLVVKYTDSKGKLRYKGGPALRKSESLT